MDRKRFYGLGRLKAGVMNKTEARYALTLEQEKQSGSILSYWFEAITLRLAPRTSLTPDFMVMKNNGEIEFREVKGFWTDDAKAKTKIAADKFPFRFLIVKAAKGKTWAIEEI